MTDKERYIEILKTVNRAGVDQLIDYLENSDFFEAPASTKYHGAFEGGLCAHSLRVYDIIVKLNDTLGFNVENESLIIASLLHDLAKVNTYEKTFKNVKVYTPNGDKHDKGGNFEWQAQESYKTRDDVFVYGNHESTCEFIARQFIQLSIAESAAILHHMGGLAYDSSPVQLMPIYQKYNLALLLHMADFVASTEGI